MMFQRAPEKDRLFNPTHFSVIGYPSFTKALLEGEFGTRLEEIELGINQRWACWDKESRCFDTSQSCDVIDVYSFVNASCLNRDAFSLDPFIQEPPIDLASLNDMPDHPTASSVDLLAAKKVEVSTQRKPWLL